MSLKRTAFLSAASGCAWGAIAYLLAGRMVGKGIWGGVLVSPVIGVLVGLTAARLRKLPAGGRAFVSLVGLYGATCLFGLAVGVGDLATGVNRGEGWHRIPGAVIMQSAVGFLWGLTFMGYIVVLWPLSYLNCWLIWKQADARNEPVESGGNP
jgi:hypothetical protein